MYVTFGAVEAMEKAVRQRETREAQATKYNEKDKTKQRRKGKWRGRREAMEINRNSWSTELIAPVARGK